jgi:Tfp pilus assembly protein PilF
VAFSVLHAAADSEGASAGKQSAERWRKALRARGLDPRQVQNPLAFTGEMLQAATEWAGPGGPVQKLEALQGALFDADKFPFTYETRGTLTAAEAFRQRRGNCLSFTNLFLALGRAIGIEVRAAIPAYEGRIEKEGDLVIVNEHVVAAYMGTAWLAIFDFDRATQRRQVVGATLIDDLQLGALYYNNLAIEALRAGQVGEAVELLETAVALDPRSLSALGNLGVARRRAGDDRGAFDAYRRALDVDRRDGRILGNLATLFRSQGKDREARAAVEAASPRDATPYYYIVRGDLEMTQGSFDKALKYYRQASRRAANLADPWVASAEAEIARGHPTAARRMLDKALELDPDHAEARALYQRLDKP